MASYSIALSLAKADFAIKLRSCTTRSQANRVVADVANAHAGSIAITAQDCLSLLNNNPDLMTRTLPDSEMADCQTIIDVVFTFLEHDIARALETLIPTSLPEA